MEVEGLEGLEGLQELLGLAAAAAAAIEAEGIVQPQQQPQGSINLAAFSADSQNVHTGPAQQSTARAIEILLERKQNGTLRSILDCWKERGVFSEELRVMLEDTMDFCVAERVVPSFNLDISPTVKHVSYREVIEIIWQHYARTDTYAFQQTLSCHLARILRKQGADASPKEKVESLMDHLVLLCDFAVYDAAEKTTSRAYSLTGPASSSCVSRRSSVILYILGKRHTVYDGLFANVSEELVPHHLSSMFRELVNDVDRVTGFGTDYKTILDCVWSFAFSQSNTVQREIMFRLIEEVMDGRGMCCQGKMTRLVNVLRGFDPALDDVPVLSISEQLQARMSVISTLPVAERRTAATATFAELAIPEAEQAPWLEAVLDA